jgi:hypothetical protein
MLMQMVLSKKVWDVDIRGDNHVNRCMLTETLFVAGYPELLTVVMISRLLQSRLVTVGPCKGPFVRYRARLLNGG